MVLGQTSANLVGVPLGSLIGFALSWRLIFGFIAVLALLLILALTRWLPSMPVVKQPLTNELSTLKSWHPWFILSGVAIGSAASMPITPTLTRSWQRLLTCQLRP